MSAGYFRSQAPQWTLLLVPKKITKASQTTMEAAVKQLEDLQGSFAVANTPPEKARLSRQIEVGEARVNELV